MTILSKSIFQIARLISKISDEELAKRRTEQDAKGWQPANREREVSFALKVFGHFATSADKGAVRDKSLLK